MAWRERAGGHAGHHLRHGMWAFERLRLLEITSNVNNKQPDGPFILPSFQNKRLSLCLSALLSSPAATNKGWQSSYVMD